MVKRLTDIGIINSICSKNDLEMVEEALNRENIRDYFVFLSVNWEAKGQRIKKLIEDMQLRPDNVLFLDDNHLNLEEAKYYCPKIMTAGPDAITDLCHKADACKKQDLKHTRLKQYQLLEQKAENKTHFASNEEFLYSSDITVCVNYDCINAIERIYDLVWRSNQLNFTKKRSSMKELKELLLDPDVLSGYVQVEDRFGDYGIVGFFAVKNGELIHFCFSCRTLGMGIEQFIYHFLERPRLSIVGQVISDLSQDQPPGWIHLLSGPAAAKADDQAECSPEQAAVLMKGPCDLFQIMPYLKGKRRIDAELSYVNSHGIAIESAGHTTQIVESLRLTQRQKELVCSEVPFADMGMYSDRMFKNPYKLVIISILADANLGVYRRKNTGERVCFFEGYRPITDEGNWDGYIAGKYDGAEIPFTKNMLQEFADRYEFVGINSPEQITENLKYIRRHLRKDCLLAVMLGGELQYEKNTSPVYENRHLVHKNINDAIKRMAAEVDGIHLIDVNRYLIDQRSFYDHFNHYIKPVYYQLAEEISQLITQQTGENIAMEPKAKMAMIYMKNTAGRIKRRLLKPRKARSL